MGSQMKTEHPLQRDNGICFIQKWLTEVLNTFIPLGEETINSSLVERSRSLMDPQAHPLLLFLVRMKPTSTNVFFLVVKNVEVTRRKNWDVRRMLKCFPVKSPKLIPHQIWQYGDGRYHAKGWFRLTAFQGVLILWNFAALSATKKRSILLCSSLFASISNAAQTHFTLHSPLEQ